MKEILTTFTKIDSMKNLLIASGIVGVAAMVACEEHEVIPPPVPLVDLKCECTAIIDDSTVSYSDTCTYASIKTIGTPGISSAEYYAYVEEQNFQEGMELEIRSIEWTDDGSNKPSLDAWVNFFNSNIEPKYYPETTAPADAVVLRWTDMNGTVWTTDSSNICLSDFVFTSFVQESDTTGDYMTFEATYSGTLWNGASSKCIESGVIKSAFRLD
jgi:hypothetical protein